MPERITIDRPPRLQPELTVATLKIPAPPQTEPAGLLRLLQVGLPLLTLVGFAAVTMLSGGSRSPWMLVPMALSVVGASGFSLYSYLSERRKQAEAERAYAARLVALNREMVSHHDQQRRFYSYNYPDPGVVVAIPQQARDEVEQHDRPLRTAARLWERRPTEADFGALRLGLGVLPSFVVYTLDGSAEGHDALTRAALRLQDDSRFVHDIPVVISLRRLPSERETSANERDETQAAEEQKATVTPSAHALGIAGNREDVYAVARALLCQYAVFHAPSDAKLYMLASSRTQWSWTESLPHCAGGESQKLTLWLDSVSPAGDAARGTTLPAELSNYLEGLRRVLAQRQLRLRETDARAQVEDPTLPLILLVVDLFDATDDSSPLRDLESDAAMSLLLAAGADLGAAVVFLAPERAKIPGPCAAVVEIGAVAQPGRDASEESHPLCFRYAQTGVNGFRYVGHADSLPSLQTAKDVATTLAQLQMRHGFGADLPNAVPFLSLLHCESLADLVAQTRLRWQSSRSPQHSDWLRATLGRVSGGKARSLVFSSRQDGVHGMIAGSTGSGKSELLISLITMMALHYSPTALNFVLLDYKGGGAFADFQDLPHCVDMITNLGVGQAARMFSAIRAELNRRQALLKDSGVKTIVEYQRNGLHETRQPLPFLFIIIDEFAELIADRPDYKAELETITRLGRSLGVSLILAAQRPSGITDQMRSNIKFRICLRVETGAESREILRRTDAAYLPGNLPGRGLLQVGNDEVEPIQVAYCGDRHIDPANRPLVLWPDRPQSRPSSDRREQPELYKSIIAALARLAKDDNLPVQSAPWPSFLPDRLFLTSVLVAQSSEVEAITAERYFHAADLATILLGAAREASLSLNPALSGWLDEGSMDGAAAHAVRGWIEPLDWGKHALRGVVGLVDNPYAGRQEPLVVDLANHHAVVFGMSGQGKTSLVKSLVVSLAATHAPDAVRFYIVDTSGLGLMALRALPHVDAVITTSEDGFREQIEQVLRALDEIIAQRKQTLTIAGLSEVGAYNALHPTEALPGLVLIIDGFGEFQKSASGRSEQVESLMDRFLNLARECRPYGIHLVVTASEASALPDDLRNLLTQRLTLKLADPSDYRAILGSGVEDLGDTRGRGYVATSTRPLAFQVALPFDPAVSDETQGMQMLAATMGRYIAQTERDYPPLIPVGPLPKSITVREMLSRAAGLKALITVDQLREWTRQAWQRSLDPTLADWLRVPLGLRPGDRIRELYLKAEYDGVHGLIAGGTGSGKSELLSAFIVGLALSYAPDILNFVIVDYKGGGAFKPFETLPHCVDLVTNLNSAAVARLFTVLGAELRRRQQLNADTGTKDIVEYRRQGLHRTHAPYPHLFLIIDEYAEMMSEYPQFKAELESVARTGRAQGVSLILASQRPTGVTDQMRANIKLRLCLRVDDVDVSREVLRRPDAAALPSGQPGRGYLQGSHEAVELLQVAWTGDKVVDAASPEREESRPFFEVAVQIANELLDTPRPIPPWPPVLPTALAFTAPLVEAYVPAGILAREQSAPALTLNSALVAWSEGRGSWPGIDWGSRAMRGVVGLVDDARHARHLPLVVDLNRGHAVVVGASGTGKTTLVRSLVASLAATHSPGEFHAHVLDLGGRSLQTLACLPHVGTIITPADPGYEERVEQLLRSLDDLVEKRKTLFSEMHAPTLTEYNLAHPDDLQPAILVIIDNMTEYIETFGGQKSAGDANVLDRLVSLLRQSRAYGVHFLVTAASLNALSSRLFSLFTERLALRLANPDDYAAILGAGPGPVEDIPGRGSIRVGRQEGAVGAFQVAVLAPLTGAQGPRRSEDEEVRRLGEQMRAHIAATSASFPAPLRVEALPHRLSYRPLLLPPPAPPPGSVVAALMTATARRWAYHRTPEAADWLKVSLGLTSGGRPREVYLKAQQDGVHGLVAGGTGSGKSELLMTLIVGLALTYPPDILNFVLVDYKGGGAFKPFARLPHCVDLVTNLNKAAVNRMFIALDAEIKRRQQLNADSATKDIIEYRRQGLHLTRAPYPHLFVIIDEYTEMIDDLPDYRGKLESLTRVGRAQGVHLLLAAQKPKGVSDQMRANMKLKLCLRVEDAETSVELLRRPDAVFLPNGLPGRGYLQAGNDPLELIQVAYCGEAQPDDRPVGVVWPDRPSAGEAALSDMPKLFDTAVMISAELTGRRRANKPWPSFLPSQVSLQSPVHDAQRNDWFTLRGEVTAWLNGETEALWPGLDWRTGAMQAVVGLVDNPAQAAQTSLCLDLKKHLAVYGDPRSGKTTLLRSLLVSLATTHSPADLHMYVLDLAGRNFSAFEQAPHCGGVFCADDDAFEERLRRLLGRLNRLTDTRQAQVATAGVATVYDYNRSHRDQPLPAILVVIDDFAPLQENFAPLVENTLMPLMRRSLAAGITFVVTATHPSAMTRKLSALFDLPLTLRQSKAEHYLDIVGRGAVELDNVPGRGYVRLGGQPLQFQAALPVGLPSATVQAEDEAAELALLAQQMQMAWRARSDAQSQACPARIEILPATAPLVGLLERAAPPQSRRVEAVIGESAALQPLAVDLQRTAPHFIIQGPPRSGRTTALYTWALSLASRYPPGRVGLALIDLQRKFADYGGTQRLDELPHVLATAYDVEEVDQLVERIEAAAHRQPAPEIFVLVDDFDDALAEIEARPETSRRLLAAVRRLDREGLHCVVVGALDSSGGDLRRRITRARFGVALRTQDAVASFGVTTLPAVPGGRELPVGRGFIVQAGQTMMVQLANPYVGLGESGAPRRGGEPDDAMPAALDQWIERVRGQYPGWPGWTPATPAATPTPAPPTEASTVDAYAALVRRACRWELAQQADKPWLKPVVSARVVDFEPAAWSDEVVLASVMRDALVQLWRSTKTPEVSINSLISTMDAKGYHSYLDSEIPRE